MGMSGVDCEVGWSDVLETLACDVVVVVVVVRPVVVVALTVTVLSPTPGVNNTGNCRPK